MSLCFRRTKKETRGSCAQMRYDKYILLPVAGSGVPGRNWMHRLRDSIFRMEATSFGNGVFHRLLLFSIDIIIFIFTASLMYHISGSFSWLSRKISSEILYRLFWYLNKIPSWWIQDQQELFNSDSFCWVGYLCEKKPCCNYLHFLLNVNYFRSFKVQIKIMKKNSR